MNRADMLERLRAASSDWEVLIIGGGATGLGTALDAAARGYRTAIVEQADFAQATSSRSSKLIHGGLRYLKQGRLGLVRESLRERRRLLHNAPHLVRPLPFLIPNYAWWERGFYGAGMKLYDWMDDGSGLEPARHLTCAAALERASTLKPDGLRGGILYHDAQFDDARLALALAQSVADCNGVVLNYVKVTGLLKQNDHVTGARLRDLETGEELEARARVVINAAGVFADEVRRLDNERSPALLAVSQGAHIVLEPSFLPGECALTIPRTTDGRIFFAIPWQNRVLLGTTESAAHAVTLEPRPLRDEIAFLLEHAARYLARAPSESDILSAFAGLRPLLKGADGKPTATLSRGHRVEVARSGLVTVTGGKWTTYRQMAEEAVNRAAETAGLPRRAPRTRRLRLHGGEDFVESESSLAHYGTDAWAVRGLCSEGDGNTLLHPRLPYRVGEVRWAVRREMARTVADVLARRTRALFLDARAATEMAPAVARVMAKELGRDIIWENEQVAAFRELARGYLVS